MQIAAKIISLNAAQNSLKQAIIKQSFFPGRALPDTSCPLVDPTPCPNHAIWIRLCVTQNSSEIYAYDNFQPAIERVQA